MYNNNKNQQNTCFDTKIDENLKMWDKTKQYVRGFFQADGFDRRLFPLASTYKSRRILAVVHDEGIEGTLECQLYNKTIFRILNLDFCIQKTNENSE